MVNRRGRTRRSARRRPQNTVRTLTRRLARHEAGTSFKPAPTPPMWTATPWFPLTIVDSYTATTVITVETVANTIRAALGWKTAIIPGAGSVQSSPLPISFRMVSARLYGMSAQPIQLTAYELLGGKHLAKELNDIGGKSSYSSVGWRWGTQSRIDVLQETDTTSSSSTDKQKVVTVSGTANNSRLLLYLQVLFKAADAPTVSQTLAKARAPGALTLADMEII